MRTDRSDPADGPGDVHIASRVQSAPDYPPAAAKDAGKTAGGGPPDLSPASLDPALRTERATDYRASVDAFHRQTSGVDGGDVPDDPRNHSNLRTGRLDASWFTYDRAISAARGHAGGDLGPDSIKMYDLNPETGEGTGTLIGEQSPDRLRGWRIDGKDGHVNWWDWTDGKKGAGGAYGHDWFPEDPSVPGSRYIGWAPWQDGDGNILEGN